LSPDRAADVEGEGTGGISGAAGVGVNGGGGATPAAAHASSTGFWEGGAVPLAADGRERAARGEAGGGRRAWGFRVYGKAGGGR
jgi:hypothetical protein